MNGYSADEVRNFMEQLRNEAEDAPDREDQDEAEKIAANVEELYLLGQASDVAGLERAFRSYVEDNRPPESTAYPNPDLVDYEDLAAFLQD